MTALAAERPLVRKGQTWRFEGQSWRVHEVLADGVIVLIGPAQFRDLQGVTADELHAAGSLLKDAPAPDAATERLAKAFEKAQGRLRREANGGVKRVKKPRPTPSARPWRCTILAVDCAEKSGWSIWHDGRLTSFGLIVLGSKEADAEVLKLCLEVHELNDRPAALVLEHPAAIVYPGRSPAALIALGAAVQAWERGWRDANGVLRRLLHVKPPQWRAELFGASSKRYAGGYPEMEKQMAILTLKEFTGLVHSTTQYPANDNGHELPADVNAGICIGRWATRSGQVGDALPVSLRITV